MPFEFAVMNWFCFVLSPSLRTALQPCGLGSIGRAGVSFSFFDEKFASCARFFPVSVAATTHTVRDTASSKAAAAAAAVDAWPSG